MPQPFAKLHPSFMRNFATTGKSGLLGRQTEMVALHKTGYCLPVCSMVSKARGGAFCNPRFL